MKIKKIEEQILRTLLYSDIFDYPLNDREAWSFLIGNKKINSSDFGTTVKEINTVVYRKKGFLYVGKREELVQERIRRQNYSKEKLRLGVPIIQKLARIPTVRLIGISGSLSVMNSRKEDDIDIFVIAKSDTIWITRLLLIGYLKFLRVHRGRNSKNLSNKICLNMLVDEKRLALSNKARNLYTAHEVAQLMPIVERGSAYKKFTKANGWIEKFMPNALENMMKKEILRVDDSLLSEIIGLSIFEKIARMVQIFRINRNMKTETVSEGYIAFYPSDRNDYVLTQYQQQLSRYNLKNV